MTDLISDPEIEGEVISELLFSPYKLEEVDEYLTADCFTEPPLREIYTAIKYLYDNGKPRDVFEVRQELFRRGTKLNDASIISYMGAGGRYGDIVRSAKRLQDMERRRQIWHFASITLAQSNDTEAVPLDEIYDRMQNFLNNITSTSRVVTLDNAVQELRQRIQDNIDGKEVEGTPTGFRKLDEAGGLHKGDLVVVAGSTSHGKTSFALAITLNAIMNRRVVAFYSMEMDKVELTARLVAMKSGINTTTILYKRPYGDDYHDIENAMESLPVFNLIFDDRATARLDSILASIRTLYRKYKIDGAVIDYLQILNINDNGRETQEQLMAYAARRMKNLAKELGIWIIALSQLNRMGDEKSAPTLARLRNSGQIAEAADIVLLIYRPEMVGAPYVGDFANYPTFGTALVDIAKGRNIGTGKFICRFKAETTYFFDDSTLRPMDDEQRREEMERISAKSRSRFDDDDNVVPF